MAQMTLAGVEITDKLRASLVSADGRPRRRPIYLNGDFSTGDTNQYSGIEAADLANQFLITNVGGIDCARFRVRNGDIASSGERIEVKQIGHRWANNEELFEYFAIRMPVGFVDTLTGTQFKIFHQAHDNSSVGPPNWAMRIKNGNFDISFNTGTVDGSGIGTFVVTETFLSGIQKDIWYKFVVQCRWRTTTTGLLRIWRVNDDGSLTLLYEKLNIITLQVPGAGAASQDIYPKLGFYRNISPDTYTDDLYHADYRSGQGFWDLLVKDRDPDMSIGIFPAARNVVLYSNCQVGTDWITNGAGVTATPENTPFIFEADSPWRCHVTTPGTGIGEGLRVRRTLAAQEVGGTYVGSIFAQRSPGSIPVHLRVYSIISYSDSSSDSGLATPNVFDIPVDFPRRLYAPPMVANPAKSVTGVRTCYETRVQQTSDWIAGGAQIEDGKIATPTIFTNGATASRTNGRARFSNSYYGKDQGFCILAFRSNFDWTLPPGDGTGTPRFWIWGDVAADAYQLYWAEATNNFNFRKVVAGVNLGTASVSLPILRGGNYIAACTWDASNLRLLVLDCYRPTQTFATASAVGTFNNDFDQCDLGRLTSSGTSYAYMDFFYAIAGKAFLGNSDVSAIAQLGIFAPRLGSLPTAWDVGAVVSGFAGGEFQSREYANRPSEVLVA